MSVGKIGLGSEVPEKLTHIQRSRINIAKPTNSYNSKVANMHGMQNSHEIWSRDVNANNLSVFSIDVSKIDRQKISKMLADNIDSTAEKFLNNAEKPLRTKITLAYQNQLQVLKSVVNDMSGILSQIPCQARH